MRVPRSSLVVLAAAAAALGASSTAGAATWTGGLAGPAIDLDAPVVGPVNDPRVATTSDGTAVSAWDTADGPSVRVATRAPGSATWSPALDLTAIDPEVDGLGALTGVSDVQVATGRHGEAVVSWWEDTAHGTIVRVAVRRGDGPWVISSPSGIDLGDVDDPTAAVADDGRITVAWFHNNGDSDEGLRVATLVGDAWTGAEAIDGAPSEPRLGYLPDGDLLGAYEDEDTGEVVVDEWHDGVRTEVPDLAAGNSGQPDLAIARDGRAAVVWEDENGSDRAARAAVRSASGVWTTSLISHTGTDVDRLKVEASEDGFVAAWDIGYEASGPGADTASLGAGTTWTPPQTLTPDLPGNAESDLAVAPDGSATVVWEDDTDDDDALLESRTRPAGGDWGPTQEFGSSPVGQSSGPQVAAYGDGSFTAVWRDIRPTDDNEVVQSGLLDRTGPAITATLPSTTTIGVPLNLSAVADDLWNDVEAVGWTIDDGPALPGRDVTWTPTSLGDHTIVVRAQDTQGNETVRTFVVRVVPVEVPAAVSSPPAQTPPATGRPAPAPVAPPQACAAPYVEVVGIRAGGTARKPRVRLTGVTGPSLVGRRVEVRRDGKGVGTAKVGRDRSIVVSVPAPHGAKERARARYRLIIGDARSRALQASREATISRSVRLKGGRVGVTGRVATIRRATTLKITGTPACGTARTVRTTVRTDAHGRFRVTLAPTGTAGAATIYRITAPGRETVTLPVVVTTP